MFVYRTVFGISNLVVAVDLLFQMEYLFYTYISFHHILVFLADCFKAESCLQISTLSYRKSKQYIIIMIILHNFTGSLLGPVYTEVR